jgi:tetratricopeptide (TPR) repeat protein
MSGVKCPRCGFEAGAAASCPRCGVVFAKLRASPVPRAPERPAPGPPPAAGSSWPRIALGLALVVLAVVGLRHLGEAPSPAVPSPRPAQPQADVSPIRPLTAPSTETDALRTPPTTAPDEPTPEPLPPGGLSAEDVRLANELARRLDGPASAIGPAELSDAQALLARHGGEPGIRRLAAAVFASRAVYERAQRRGDEALALVERAIAADAANRDVRALQVALLIEAGDWAAAETAARALLEIAPGDREGLSSLGFALFRQDRNREAIEALREAVAAGDEGQAKALLARLEKGARDEQGMTEQRLAHFHVRYDGDAHEDVGREILRALERHYATLAMTLDQRPSETIPVILFSRQAYYNASGAPAWSGGVFDTLDGRIRIPIGGLTTSLTPDIDETLIHELTHAFVHDLSAGRAPRDLHEGLAQYMEGKRLASSLPPQALQALAEGRLGGVNGFYFEALGFVEYLLAQRGIGGIKDLLGAMGAGASAPEAYERVYGKGQAALAAEARAHLKSRHGG